MKVDNRKNKQKVFDAAYVAQNEGVNSSVRATHTLLSVLQLFGVTVDKVTAKPQVVGPDDLAFSELEQYAHPDKGYAIAIDFGNVGGSSNLEGNYVGTIVEGIRKNLDGGNDPFWAVQGFTGLSPEQLLLAMYNAPGPNGEENPIKKAVLTVLRTALTKVVEAEDFSATQAENMTPSPETFTQPVPAFVPEPVKSEPATKLEDIVVPIKDADGDSFGDVAQGGKAKSHVKK